MNDLQKRLEIQGAVQQWAASFMYNNNVSAAMMEDALSQVLVSLKQQIIIDLLIEQQNQNKEKNEEGGIKEDA